MAVILAHDRFHVSCLQGTYANFTFTLYDMKPESFRIPVDYSIGEIKNGY